MFLDSHEPIFRGKPQSDIVEILNVDCTKSICEADVVLKKPLKFDTIENKFEVHKIRNESSRTLSNTEVKVKAGFLVASEGLDFSLEIRDTNGEATTVKSHLHPTSPRNAFIGLVASVYPSLYKNK